MKKFLGLPSIKAELIGQGTGEVCLVCLTLPMGLSHSVILAQKAHIFILQQFSFARFINRKVSNNSEFWIMVYIDNVIMSVRSNRTSTAEQQLNQYLDEALQAYQKVGLPVNQKKIERATTSITGLGCYLSDKQKGISPNNAKISEVIGATKLFLQCDRASTKAVENLLYRPLYAIFFHTYRWLHKDENQGQIVIWTSVKREFSLAILFADKCHLTWNRQNDSSLLASDALLAGAGACEILLKAPLRDESEYDDFPEHQLRPLDWVKNVNQRWLKLEHINVLELRALLLAAVQWIDSPQHKHTRWKIIIDSKVIEGAIQKGRSSAYMICCLLRRVDAVCLRIDVTITTRWVSTHNNPADLFSRVFSPRPRNALEDLCGGSHLDSPPQQSASMQQLSINFE